jgi:hypothetical protein
MMTAERVKDVFFGAIREAEAVAFDARAEEVGVLRARDEWQGHDNLIQWFEWAEWVGRYADEYDPEIHAEDTVEEYATEKLGTTIGDGEPLAVAWQEGFGCLIRSGATEEEVRDEALAFLPADEPDWDSVA